MTETGVVIPFKGASRKTRLSTVLSQARRKEFTLLMLGEVLDAVAGTGLVAACYVVSPDQNALELARSRGANAVKEAANRGVDTAVTRGMRAAGAEEILVIPADLPLLSSHDLERAMALKSEAADVVISPSQAFDGTNLLFFSNAKPIRLSYDRDSFWNHLENAALMKRSLAVYTGMGVLFDVDTARDLWKLAGAEIKGSSVAFAKEALMRRDSL